MSLVVENGKIGLRDDVKQAKTERRLQFKRSLASHLGVLLFGIVLTAGLSLQDRQNELKEQTRVFENLATYAGCAARDPLNNFYWTTLHQPNSEEQEAPVMSVKKPAKAKVR